MEVSTAFATGGVPDPFFSRPNIKEKKVVWLRETSPIMVYDQPNPIWCIGDILLYISNGKAIDSRQ